jgi:hypothetical protein
MANHDAMGFVVVETGSRMRKPDSFDSAKCCHRILTYTYRHCTMWVIPSVLVSKAGLSIVNFDMRP